MISRADKLKAVQQSMEALLLSIADYWQAQNSKYLPNIQNPEEQKKIDGILERAEKIQEI